ncbi:MAG TPA: lipopolysaccharide biosynthesis protein [Thermoanaerobaculia bacterium]|nr:lipopolysaccharide biosynthesis protein [Thermoanaerobaculia bacterium]
MSIGRTAARAAVWAFAGTAGSKIVTLVSLALLARLLSPAEFGLLAFALVYITYADTIGDLGSGMALIYWPERREDAAQVTFLVSVASGIFWCLLTLLIASPIADFFNAPHGAPLVRALAIGFILRYLGNTHDALAQKDLRFRARLGPDLALALVNAVVSVTLAWLGYGAWSLVWGRLASVGCRTALLWVVVPWRPSLTVPWDLVKPMLGYGRGILVVNILGAITANSDLAVVGRVLGPTALGLYQMAGRVPEMSVMVLLWVLSSVLFPAFSQLHAAGEDLREPYLMATRYISALTIPAAVGLAVLARPIVLFVFGDAWAAAAPVLTALSAVAAMRCLTAHAGDILKATGRAKMVAQLSFVKAVLILPALIVGTRWGGVGVAMGLVIATAIASAITLVTASRVIGVPLAKIARSFWPSVASSMAMLAAVAAWLRWMDGSAPVVQVAGGVTLGGIVYVAALALLDRKMLRIVKPADIVRGAAQ